MKLRDIMGELHTLYNPKSAEDWDNVGLIIGDENKEINKILFCLDVTKEAINKAIDEKVDLIISHHPFVFHAERKITSNTLLGEKILKVIENKIAIYSIHTNSDMAFSGLNDFILGKIVGNEDIQVCDIKEYEDYNPYKKVMEIHRRGEIRTKTLKNSITLHDLIGKIKKNLNIDFVRYVGDKNREIKKVAIITGAGGSFINKSEADVDVFLTGDLGHHNALDALEENKLLVDIGHYESEYLFVELMEEKMKSFFKGEMIKFYDKPIFQLG